MAVAPMSAAPIGTITGLSQTVFPIDLTGTDPGTLVDSLVSNYSFNTSAGTTSGTLTTAVYRRDNGELDFYYQVANDAVSATSIARETNTSFTGFMVGTGYRTDGGTDADLLLGGFAAGNKPPVTADSNGNASVIGFSFNLADTDKIAPGERSMVLVVSTNATQYIAGNSSIIDGGTQTVAAFQPFVGSGDQVPEPATLGLIGAGLVAVALRRKMSS